MTTDSANELREVLGHYDLGTLLKSERDERGTVNTSFVIDLEKGGAPKRFFLRRYKAGIRPEEIVFEHALIDHLTARGSCPVARVHRTRSGASYLRVGSPSGEGTFYAVFDYLPGEDRYTWVDPRCTAHELRGAGRLLAQFHSDVASLKAPGRRAEPKITELLTCDRRRLGGVPRSVGHYDLRSVRRAPRRDHTRKVLRKLRASWLVPPVGCRK